MTSRSTVCHLPFYRTRVRSLQHDTKPKDKLTYSITWGGCAQMCSIFMSCPKTCLYINSWNGDNLKFSWDWKMKKSDYNGNNLQDLVLSRQRDCGWESHGEKFPRLFGLDDSSSNLLVQISFKLTILLQISGNMSFHLLVKLNFPLDISRKKYLENIRFAYCHPKIFKRNWKKRTIYRIYTQNKAHIWRCSCQSRVIRGAAT